jgi:plastocyanin
MVRIASLILLLVACAFGAPRKEAVADPAGVVSLTGTVVVTGKVPRDRAREDVVVWLSPVGETSGARPAARPPATTGRFKIVQQNKRFSPHLLVVPTGGVVDFPNLDPFFHNAFSLFNGRRFDLGLYESGASRSATFNTPGISYIFCNIHSDMTAVVVSLDTPYFARSNRTGDLSLKDVPAGRYTLSIWHERYTPERPDEFPRVLAISPATMSLGVIRLVEADAVSPPHTNKYGRDYIPAPTGPLYRGRGGGLTGAR